MAGHICRLSGTVVALPGRLYCHPEPYSGNRYVDMSGHNYWYSVIANVSTATCPAELLMLPRSWHDKNFRD